MNGQPVAVGTPEGRLVPDGSGGWRHEYFLKDHLGNTRAVVAGTLLPGTADVLQTTSYYPFGLTMAQTDYNTLLPNYHENRYLYNGKELQTEGSEGVELGWLDYGARMYDAALGRWHVIDPLLGLTYSFSPYIYCGNNPLSFLDRDGKAIIKVNGGYTYTEEDAVRAFSILQSKYSNIRTIDKDVLRYINTGVRYLRNIENGDINGAVNVMVRSYHLNNISKNYILAITSHSFATTGDVPGGDGRIQMIKFPFIQNSKEIVVFDELILSLLHEFVHVYQRTGNRRSDAPLIGDENKGERETLAYGMTFFPNDARIRNDAIPNISLPGFMKNENLIYNFWNSFSYNYNSMSPDLKAKYSYIYERARKIYEELKSKNETEEKLEIEDWMLGK